MCVSHLWVLNQTQVLWKLFSTQLSSLSPDRCSQSRLGWTELQGTCAEVISMGSNSSICTASTLLTEPSPQLLLDYSRCGYQELLKTSLVPCGLVGFTLGFSHPHHFLAWFLFSIHFFPVSVGDYLATKCSCSGEVSLLQGPLSECNVLFFLQLFLFISTVLRK